MSWQPLISQALGTAANIGEGPGKLLNGISSFAIGGRAQNARPLIFPGLTVPHAMWHRKHADGGIHRICSGTLQIADERLEWPGSVEEKLKLWLATQPGGPVEGQRSGVVLCLEYPQTTG